MRRLAKLAHRLRLKTKLITDELDESLPYLLRVFLTPAGDWWSTRMPSVFIHHFYRGDHDREYHNHPWRCSVSFVLSGGYTEYRKDGRYAPVREYFLRPGRLNIIWHDTFHRVDLHDEEEGATTLFIAMPRKPKQKDDEGWGFVPADGSTYEDAEVRFQRLERERRA